MKRRYLIDTPVFVWALQAPERLSRGARRVFASAEAELQLSSISLAEIAFKSSRGKLELERADAVEGIAALRLRVIAWQERHGLELFDLPMRQRDPFDRMIVAQAMAERVPLVTADESFRLYPGVEVVW